MFIILIYHFISLNVFKCFCPEEFVVDSSVHTKKISSTVCHFSDTTQLNSKMMRTRPSMKKYKNEVVTYCPCGGHFIKNNKKRHENSLMHCHWVRMTNIAMNIPEEDLLEMFWLIDD